MTRKRNRRRRPHRRSTRKSRSGRHRISSRRNRREASGYWGSVEAAADAVEEMVEEGYEMYDVLHETVDGSSYIIYTNKAMEVLNETNNRNAYFDHMGGSIQAKSVNEALTQFAYYAMYQDVADELRDRGVSFR